MSNVTIAEQISKVDRRLSECQAEAQQVARQLISLVSFATAAALAEMDGTTVTMKAAELQVLNGNAKALVSQKKQLQAML